MQNLNLNHFVLATNKIVLHFLSLLLKKIFTRMNLQFAKKELLKYIKYVINLKEGGDKSQGFVV